MKFNNENVFRRRSIQVLDKKQTLCNSELLSDLFIVPRPSLD